MARIEAAAVKGSVLYTDEFASYNDLSRFGKHVPIGHRADFDDGGAHNNGIEGVGSDAGRRHGPCRGVDRENVPTYLAEHDSRYNHRDEQLPRIFFDRLNKPRLIKGRSPWKIPGHQE